MGTAHSPALELGSSVRGETLSDSLKRVFAPTLLDLLFISVIAWSFLTPGTGWGRLLWDGDSALHTAIGNWILEHQQIPVTDMFSYTLPGGHWRAVEWGTGVLFALLNGAVGLKGIVLVCGVAIAATVTLIARTSVAAGSGSFVAMGLALLGNNALLLHYHARPHLFTLLFFALSVWTVSSDRLRPTSWIWSLPALNVLWANLHPGFVLLILYCGLIAAGYALRLQVVPALRYAAVGVACALTALINPFGTGLYAEILGYFRATGMTDLIQEFQAPTFRSGPQLNYLLFLMAGVGLLGILIQRREYSDALVIAALAYASLISVRHSTVFVIAAAPVIGREITRALARMKAHGNSPSISGVLADLSRECRPGLERASIVPVLFVGILCTAFPASGWPQHFDKKLFPVTLASRNAAVLSGTRVFTSEQWADYLLLSNYPGQRVFFDDRSLYGETMFREVADLMQARPGSLRTLDRYAVESALLPPDSPLTAALSSSPGWRETDRDTTAVLLRRAE